MTASPGRPGGHGDEDPGAADGREPLPGTPVTAGTPGHRRRKLALRVTVILLLCLMGGLHGITERLTSNVARVPAVFDGLDPAERPAQPTGEAARGLTFLLAGSDSLSSDPTTGTDAPSLLPGGQRSDVVMVVRLSPDRERAAVVSIPRDSWVLVPGQGMAKVNAAYSWGGPTLMVRTVENLTGLRVDHFAVIDFAGFETLVDAVGGIDLAVVGTANAVDRFHLDGREALAYVRVRYGLPLGDLDRVRRQQNALRALHSKITSGDLLTDPFTAYQFVDAVSRSVSVDDTLTDADLRSFVFGLRHLGGGGIAFTTAPVTDVGQEGEQSVVHLDHERGAEVWRALGEDRLAPYLEAHPASLLGEAPR
ncbi:MAG TPA: LCP family protein [Umezawaea sp.]|nr:LCP family protein [Umezawaea sp.]